MKIKLVFFILLCCTVQVVFAQSGKTGLSFLKLSPGSRASAMGEAYSVIGDDPSVVNYNPAALVNAKNNQIMVTHQEWIQDTRAEYLGASTNVGDLAIGLGIRSVSISNIELRTVPGPAQGSFDAKNASMGITTAYPITDDLSLGLSANYLFEKLLVEEASGLGFNVGALYTTPWNFNVAVALNNIGSMNELKNESSVLPTTFRVGGAYSYPVKSFDGNIIGGAEIVSVKDEGKTHIHVGAEFEYKSQFALRAGYQSGYEGKGFTSGIGFKYDLIRFDYAFTPMTLDLGSAHTFTLGVAF